MSFISGLNFDHSSLTSRKHERVTNDINPATDSPFFPPTDQVREAEDGAVVALGWVAEEMVEDWEEGDSGWVAVVMVEALSGTWTQMTIKKTAKLE